MNAQTTGSETGTRQTDTTAPTTAPSPRTPAPTVWPTLQARDALGLIDFLVEKIGFHRTAVYTAGDLVAHAQLS